MKIPSWLKSESLILVGPVLEQKLNEDRLRALGIPSVPQIAVDGGDRFAVNPLIAVGDRDSTDPSTETSAVIWISKPNQDETDFGFCLDQLREIGWQTLHLFGFVGLRRDHELAVMGELSRVLSQSATAQRAFLYHESGEIALSIHRSGKHEFQHQGLFSILTFEASEVSISGQCEFPLNQSLLPSFSGKGISNQAHGTFTVESSKVFLMIPHGGVRR